jgi:hypothetical protein
MSPVPLFRRGAELARLLDEVADVDWRNPLWWALVGSAAAAEPRGAGVADYLASDGEPSADTFMAFPAAAPAAAPGLASAIAEAVVAAHAAAAALGALDGELPEQPLRRRVECDAAGARAVPCPDPRQVVFVAGDRSWLARIGERPADDATLAAALARAIAGQPSPLLFPQAADGPPPPAAIAAIIGDETPATARHAHRRAWSTRGGPWLGVSRAPDDQLAIVSTCHMIVDGYGHAWLATRIAAAIAAPEARAAARALAAAAAAIVDGAAAPALVAPPGAEPLGIAWRRVGPLPRFGALGHALGRVLWEDAGRPGVRCSPTFQVPIAPGAPDDPGRYRRRVVPALLSVRFPDGAPEPIATFAARAKATIAREAAGTGLMARLAAAARAVPAPLAWKRRAVGGSARPSLFAPAARVLGGRACLSLLRAGPELAGAPALVAVSSPALLPSRKDPHGSCVVTVVDGAGGSTVTVCGAGSTGTPEGAADLLDRWLARVATIG